ncbi:hypothetical protein SESBI_24067 [Sesbania bispinosa]|nr:hypothetical protein SESBI_24067 [Sesbania bispinosa]
MIKVSGVAGGGGDVHEREGGDGVEAVVHDSGGGKYSEGVKSTTEDAVAVLRSLCFVW